MKISLTKLYWIFLKIGAILLGGGYVILPIIIDELCKKRYLIKEDEIINYFAISQTLPGIVAANISIFSGYKLRGIFGAIVSILGIVTVPFIVILLTASLIGIFSDNPFIVHALGGVGFAVIALIFLTVCDVWNKSQKDLFFYFILIHSLILLFIFDFTPVQTVLTMSLLGIIYKKIFKEGIN